jgi:methionine synthase I (cobalamin-dependent)
MKDAVAKKTVTDAKSKSTPTKVSPNKDTLKPSSSGSAHMTTPSTSTSVSKGHKEENEVQVVGTCCGTALTNQEEEQTCVVNTGILA